MKENINITISTGSIIKTLAWVSVFAGLIYVSDLVIALLVAVVLASTVEMPVKVMAKWGVPRVFSVIIIFLVLVISVCAVAFLFIPPLADDFARFIKVIPQLLNSVNIFGNDMGFKDLSAMISNLSQDISRGQILTILKNSIFGASGFFATTSVVIQGAFNFILTFVLAFYLSLEERGVQKFLRILVPRKHEEYVEDLWMRAQKKIGLWMQGQLLLSLLVSLLVYVPSLLLGLPYASLLAVLAFVGELIPMVGLTLAMVPALFLAWTHGGLHLLWVTGLIYFIISQVESHILYPKIMSKMVGVPSVVVIIAIVVGAKIAGLWGVLLAVPLASILMELASDLEKQKSHDN
ncbi:AI-2E family transporter [Candidatus Gracilibacteria bacterium]|nr:AI-2E family transporter [Candidatus Gracilibacteria bacterium]